MNGGTFVVHRNKSKQCLHQWGKNIESGKLHSRPTSNRRISIMHGKFMLLTRSYGTTNQLICSLEKRVLCT